MPGTTRTTWRLDGFSGSPGYLNFYMQGAISGTDLDNAAAAQRTLLSSTSQLWPTGVTLTCKATATQFNEETGQLIAPVTIGALPTVFTGAGGSNYAAPAGVVLIWRTTHVANRRLTTGRSFLVPAAAPMYDSDGTLATTPRNTLQTAANTYLNRVTVPSDGRPVVWHRNTKNSSDGYAAAVTSVTINDRVAMLTSRRAR